jgi:hypothetical protein
MLFKIAWDRETSAVTFLLTEDPHLVTDSELGVGGDAGFSMGPISLIR